MDALKQQAIEGLRAARKELLDIPKHSFDIRAVNAWYAKYQGAFKRAESVSSHLIIFNLGKYWQGQDSTSTTEALLDIRDRSVRLLDGAILSIDQKQTVRPILAENILKVVDTKLSTLLNEFNNIKDTAPNSAASIFRTILSLIISIRAKKNFPTSKIAIRDDISFERDIKDAVSEKIFSSAEIKLLNRYLSGGKKDSCDNVVHKMGANTLMNKDDLEDTVSLLNTLLPTIF